MRDTSLGPAPLPELSAESQGAGTLFDVATLGHLALRVEVPLGCLEMGVSDLLEMGTGSVLPLDTQTGESLEILVNGTPVARGEVRIHGEHFAVRVTEILGVGSSPEGEDPDASHPPPTD
jgi:flagellar motor switch protein FliN/FliY